MQFSVSWDQPRNCLLRCGYCNPTLLERAAASGGTVKRLSVLPTILVLMVVPVAVAGDPVDKNLAFVDFLREV